MHLFRDGRLLADERVTKRRRAAPGVVAVRKAIYRVVDRIPFGQVLSYGDVGKIVRVGPRQVAAAMRGCPAGLPWYRVVGSGGVIRTTGSTALIQKQSLMAEGIRFRGARFSYSSYRWKGRLMSNIDKFRVEKDSMGEMQVPASALYGAQTQRAVENFPISNLRFPREFIRAMGLIKLAAAETNMKLGVVSKNRGKAIVRAAREVVDGTLDHHFVVDIFQTGSGTSTNMNTNEVISNRAIQLMGGEVGSKSPVHPNDHVNMGQSSNDVIPTAMHVAAMESIEGSLIPALDKLRRTLAKKSREFDKIVKIGRTHLQDATPVRLGQEFGGYARQVELGIHRLKKLRDTLGELPLGGTAVGTGINTDSRFPGMTIRNIAKLTGLSFREAENHFEAQSAKDAFVEASGAMKTIAASLTKIANDIRWLGSGPRCGIGEILLPETQPGSSIMPGKVNPVIAESVLQVAAQVIGNDLAVLMGGQAGVFELNVMMPVMAHNLLESIRLLSASAVNFSERCISGIQADKVRANEMIEKSLAMCTALAPEIGYDRAAAIAKESHRSGRTVREVTLDQGVVSPARLKELLDPRGMTEPGIAARKPVKKAATKKSKTKR